MQSLKLSSRIILFASVVSILSVLTNVSRAATIIAADSVTSSISAHGYGYELGYIIDQSGLSASYTSGVTDFASFVGSTTSTTASYADDTSTLHMNAHLGVDFDFVFGSAFAFTKFALWNDNDHQGIGDFSLYSSADATFSTLTLLTSDTATYGPNGYDNSLTAQSFSFGPTNTQYLRLSAVPSSSSILNFGEVAFGGEASAIPIPATIWLFGTALIGLVGLGKRKAGISV